MGHDPAPARDGVGILCDKSSRKIRQPKRLEIAVNANVQNLNDTISSEAPADHWGDVNCSGVTVLDLGAGDFGMRHDRTYMSTVDHWLDLGASSVVAVDMNLRGGAVSFTLGDIHPHDLGQFLDNSGIAVRTGHHCAWPLTRKMGVPATIRATFYLYNTLADIDVLVDGVRDAQKYFG